MYDKKTENNKICYCINIPAFPYNLYDFKKVQK